MKKFIVKLNPSYRGLICAFPITEKEEKFITLWQQKKYQEAIDTSFPDEWVWFSENLEKETVCDHTKIAGAGEAFSERAFAIIHAEFPEETKLNHPIELDGYKLIWVSPPVVETNDFESTPFNFFMAKPLYQSVYSEAFVNLWKQHGLVGHDFIETKEPRFLPKW